MPAAAMPPRAIGGTPTTRSCDERGLRRRTPGRGAIELRSNFLISGIGAGPRCEFLFKFDGMVDRMHSSVDYRKMFIKLAMYSLLGVRTVSARPAPKEFYCFLKLCDECIHLGLGVVYVQAGSRTGVDPQVAVQWLRAMVPRSNCNTRLHG